MVAFSKRSEAKACQQAKARAGRVMRRSLVGVLSLLNLGVISNAFACANHGAAGFGFHPPGFNRSFNSALNNPAAEGMAFSAAPKVTVVVGEKTEVPFTVIVPENFQEPRVLWKADDEVNVTGAKDMELKPGTDKELMLCVAPQKTGMYVLRGKLTAQLDGNLSSKSTFVLIKAVASASDLPTAKSEQKN